MELNELHTAQAMNYLKASGMPICLLINFGRPKFGDSFLMMYGKKINRVLQLAERADSLFIHFHLFYLWTYD